MDSYVFFFCRVCCCWLTALCCHFTTLDASVYYPSLPSVNEARLYIFGMANFVGLISLEVGTGQVREIEQASGRQRHRVDIVRACTMCVCVCETTTTPNFLAKKKNTHQIWGMNIFLLFTCIHKDITHSHRMFGYSDASSIWYAWCMHCHCRMQKMIIDMCVRSCGVENAEWNGVEVTGGQAGGASCCCNSEMTLTQTCLIFAKIMLFASSDGRADGNAAPKFYNWDLCECCIQKPYQEPIEKCMLLSNFNDGALLQHSIFDKHTHTLHVLLLSVLAWHAFHMRNEGEVVHASSTSICVWKFVLYYTGFSVPFMSFFHHCF